MLELLLLCAGCHGMSGEGRLEAGYPRLAGQPEAYIVRQLEAYADGRRKSAVMEPLARGLSGEERARLARDFSARTPAPVPTQKTFSQRGEALALTGDAALRVQACQNCHGPLGRGQAPYGPSLAALPAAYLRAELHAWRDGRRRSDPSVQMPLIARALPPGDLEAVVAYYAGLPVPTAPQFRPPARYERTTAETKPGIGGTPSGGTDAGGAAASRSAPQGPAGVEPREKR